MSTERSFIVTGMAGSGIVVTESISGLRAKRGFSFAIGQLLAFILLQQAISGENKKKQTRCPRGFETCGLQLVFRSDMACTKSKKPSQKLPWGTPMPKDSIIVRRRQAALQVRTTRLKDRVCILTPRSARKPQGSIMSPETDRHDTTTPQASGGLWSRVYAYVKNFAGY